MRERVSGRVAVVVVAVLAAAGLAVPAAAVTTDQSYWIPVNERITLHGHGYGHGHGMSQYGAQGAALQGRGYRDIVDFYYPGTSWSKVHGLVRVLISADTSRDVRVSPAHGLAVRDLGNGDTYVLPDKKGVKIWRLNVDHDGNTVVGFLTHRWHRFRPGGHASLSGDGEFFGPHPIRLLTPSGSATYRGRLRATSPSPGSHDRDTVNVLSMDNYVKGVVPREMPASWEAEAVRAQAVAARTYATWSRNQNRHRYYQICDTTACQVYGGHDAEDARSNRAVRATHRQILTYQGSPAFTQFSSSSGGWTAAGSVPYLPAQRDRYDGWGGNPVHDWTVTIDAGRLESAYPHIGRLRRLHVVRRDGNGAWHGRVESVVLDGSRGDTTVSGDTLRWVYGLRSDWFTVEPTPIIERWDSIGGSSSRIGSVRTREYRVGDGTGQRFSRGRIFYSAHTGAHEVYGAILREYRHRGGPKSDLGLPRTAVQPLHPGHRVKFQHGTIFAHRGTGTHTLLGRISKRYLWLGGVGSDLGWPVGDTHEVKRGLRADFQHGYIVWNTSRNHVHAHRDS